MATTSKKIYENFEADESPWQIGHFVQFYTDDSFLLDSWSSLIAMRLDAGDACIVFATEAHREQLEKRLKAKKQDFAATLRQGSYLALDAAGVLSMFMVDGQLDPMHFTETIGKIIVQAAQSHSHICIFAEMVTLVWEQGSHTTAIRLEELWNELPHKTLPFSLHCANPMHSFAGDMYEESFAEICKQHTHVIPDESYTLLATPDERLHEITLLQQKAHSLENKIAELKLAEERLRSAENHYRRLFETSQDGILIVDPRTCTIINANPCMTKLSGYPYEQLQGQVLWEIGLLGKQKANLKMIHDLLETCNLHYEAWPLHTKDGTLRYVELVGNLYKENGADVIQYHLRDVTDQKQAKEAILHLATIVESSANAILSFNLEGTVTSCNPAAERMYGYSAQCIIGQPVTRLSIPDQQNEYTQVMELIRRGEHINNHETTRIRQDGMLLLVSSTVFPMKDSHGTIIGATAISRDITEYKHLEAKFQQLFDSNLIGIFVSDFKGIALNANDTFLNAFGYTRTELQAGKVQRNALTPPEFHKLSQRAMSLLQETGTVSIYEKEYQHKNGRRIPVRIALTPIDLTDTCFGIVLDISERQELNQRKDEFISIASHELKTPVTSLKGFLSLLQRRMTTQDDEKAHRYLTRMNTQINKLTQLINDLLDLSKMQSGHITYQEERFEIDALLQEITENIQSTTQTHHLQIEGQAQAEIVGDRDYIGRVFINLLNNAIRYSPQADTVLIYATSDSDEIHVSIKDFGVGIAKEYQQKIFERFYQIAVPEELICPGLGIGLYISSEIVKQHGGQMWVESQDNKGSTFHVTLPLPLKESL